MKGEYSKQNLLMVATQCREAFAFCILEKIAQDAEALVCIRAKGEIAFIVAEGMQVILNDGSHPIVQNITKTVVTLSDGRKIPPAEIKAPHHTWIDGFEAMKAMNMGR
jgi:hypothetical protein